MILYVDTSALIKLYVREAHSREVMAAVTEANAVYSHLITYVETRAAFAKALRMGRVRQDAIRAQARRFEHDWDNMEVVTVNESLIRRAGELAQAHGLRGYDSVHLAAAEAVGLALNDKDFRIAIFDERLAGAAAALGLRCLDPG